MGGAGGGDAMGGAGGGAAEVTTAAIVELFNSPCAGCHNITYPTLADIEDWSGLQSFQSDLPIVAAGDPQGSYLYHKIAGTHLEAPANGSGAIMPMGGLELTPDEIALVEAWINGL